MTLDKPSSETYHDNLQAALIQFDPEVHKLIAKEYERLQNAIQLLAAENQCSRAALAALGSILQNKTSEGFPAARLHGGSGVMDEVEGLAIERAKRMVEAGRDVVLLLDSLTRLARAHNTQRNSGRTGSGGLDVRAL